MARPRTVLNARRKNGEDLMPDYVAGLCCMQDGALVPFNTMEFLAENHDEAVRRAVEWMSSTDMATDDSTWLQVLFNGSAFFSKEIGQL
jgi:hypothetical protein